MEEFCTVIELSNDAVCSNLEISFPLVPGEGEMLWNSVQYCQGYDDPPYKKQSDIQQVELFGTENFPIYGVSISGYEK